MTYSIYTIAHRETGRTYVGMTSLARAHDSLSHHKAPSNRTPIALAIRAEGKDQFEFKVVATAATYEEAGKIERGLIADLKETGAGVYNKSPGGDGGRPGRVRSRSPMLSHQQQAAHMARIDRFIAQLEAEAEALKTARLHE